MSHANHSPSRTFANLGLEFPLLECSIEHVPSYEPGVFCCIEQRIVDHGFRLGIGDYLRRKCPSCGTANFLRADNRPATQCRACRQTVPFPSLQDEDVYISYRALRAGLAVITTDTQYGMISWEQAEAGMTHGVPGLEVPELETEEDENGWVKVRLPTPHLWELVTTPNYITWQGERWLFSGDRPMVYLGEWDQDDFESYTGGHGFELLAELVPDSEDAARIWAALSGPNTLTTYVFRCPDTEQLDLHWDYT